MSGLLFGKSCLRQSGEWKSADQNVRLNLIPFKEATQITARINHAVQEFLDELPDEIALPKTAAETPEAVLRRQIQSMAADDAWEYDLFFSFSHQDADAVRAFCHTLRGHGLRVFFSADDLRLRGGHDFAGLIDRALLKSRHFLLFCTPAAMVSKWVKLEHETFFHEYHQKDESRRHFHIAEGPVLRPVWCRLFTGATSACAMRRVCCVFCRFFR